jgi:RNase H-fold protein (predicted Holliday junction resolvase)
VQHDKDRGNYKKKPSNRSRSKIIIIGDSHARGCSQEVKHNLDHSAEIQGIVKPGANIEVIVNTSTKSIEKLTKKDIVVVWGGTRDVGKNESERGLHQLKSFVEKNSQTNFIAMSVPHRHDLDPYSCINDEVKVYNRKLKKYLKVCDNTQIIEVDSKRELFTKHGLRMNSKGKDQTARKITQTIKVMLKKKISNPIMLKDREDLGIYSEGTERIKEVIQNEVKKPQSTPEELGTVSTVEVTQNEVKEPQSTPKERVSDTQDQKDDKLPSKRARKPPTT